MKRSETEKQRDIQHLREMLDEYDRKHPSPPRTVIDLVLEKKKRAARMRNRAHRPQGAGRREKDGRSREE